MPIYALAPATISFVNASTPAFTAFLWHFGDGGSSTDENPFHTYAADGTYVVSLTATSDVQSVTFTDLVIVGDDEAAWTQPDPAQQDCPGTDPVVTLRVSNDGGKNWVSERPRTAGKAGEYLHRVRWTRCGAGRRRVFEVVVSDPVPWRITGCYLKPSGIGGGK